ncbi:MAG: SipW-dependent-type signal peptide-containing protein [Clostridia bacterium]|nr:SipW-dependent-type signal peptide-containing protein [Clostridia bacterium]
MTKQRSTKQALVASLLVLTLCISMLIGSTFAWFTDEVVSTGNKIQAGTLKIDLEVLEKQTDGTTKWVSIKDSQAPLFNYDKWEPGFTNVTLLRVTNLGNLALKWQAQFRSEVALTPLADVIDVYVCPSETELALPADRDLSGYRNVGTLRSFVNTISSTTYGSLVNQGDVAYLGLALKMQESAGNAYQGMDLGGAFDIVIYATQLTSEEDSFGPDYDKNAFWKDAATSVPAADASGIITIKTAGELAAFAADVNAGNSYVGKTIKLGAHIDLNNLAWTPIGTGTANFNGTFDGNGYTIYNLRANGTEGVGLFGFAGNAASIHDVRIVNATVTGNHWVGAVLGYGYLSQNSLAGCTVENAIISCYPVLKDGKYDDGNQAGVIAGMAINGNIYKNTAKNSTVYAYRDLGGIVGCAQAENNDVAVYGNKVENVTLVLLSVDGAYVDNKDNSNYGDFVGRISGGKKVTIYDNAGTCSVQLVDRWDGEADTTWYNDTETKFGLSTPEQLAGLAKLVDGGNTFEGKTIVLEADIDLAGKLFDPIGSYRNDMEFKGTFDGQGNTIYNLSQNTWELNNGYYYGDLGLGLFGAVRDATIKNLNIDRAEISGESALVGIVAATAYGDCTFENITVSNSNGADYQYYAGGIVGWASGNHKYINCDVDESTVIAGQWGDFNNANGGIIGGIGASGTYYLKDCDVACQIDVHNDVVSAYHWYSYRRSGMLIGDSNATVDDNAVTTAAAPNLTCENVTVTYGEWANYTYCQFNAMGYPFVRVQAGVSCDAYSNIRYGHPVDANGNTVVDDNHVHNDGEKHNELIVFDQLYGGDTGDRYCTYGAKTHDGVTVIYNNK